MLNLIKTIKEERIDLYLGIFLLSIALMLDFIVLSGPETASLKLVNGILEGNSNVVAIRAFKDLGDGQTDDIKNVVYEITLVPRTGKDMLVQVVSNLEQSRNTNYRIKWPGSIHPHPFNSIALEADEYTSSELLGITAKKLTKDQTEISVRSREDDYHRYKDFFMFYWKSGEEKLSFTDSRVRLQIAHLNTGASANVHIGETESTYLISNSPEPTKIVPNTSFGYIDRIYENVDELIVNFTDSNKKRLSDLILIVSGVFIGMGSRYLTIWLSSIIERFRAE